MRDNSNQTPLAANLSLAEALAQANALPADRELSNDQLEQVAAGKQDRQRNNVNVNRVNVGVGGGRRRR